jgi:polysaccharide export outer membrane protein
VVAPEKAKPLEYTISIGDVLYITVWQEDLNQEVTVRPDGMISLTLVGDVQALGLTLPQLDTEITKRLQDYIRYPEVSVVLRKFGGQKVVVLGEVGFPGVYTTVSNKVTVLDAIALAGGFTQDAVVSSVIVIRGGLVNPKGIRLNLNLNRTLLKADLSQNLVLDSQDIVFVPKKFIADMNYVISQIIGPISSGAQSGFSLEKLRDARW